MASDRAYSACSSFFRLRQIDPFLAKLGQALGEQVPALRGFFRRRGLLLQIIFNLLSVVFVKCKAEKSEHHKDGSGYHQPMRILHRGALLLISSASLLRLQPTAGSIRLPSLKAAK